MTKKPEGPNRYDGFIATAGFKNVKITDINGFLEHVRREVTEGHVQFFDAKLIAGQQHLYFAALNALKAFEKKSNISSSLAIEALLYASAQRQIRKAVDTLGVKQDSSQVAVLIIAENRQGIDDCLKVVSRLIPGERDDAVLELTDEKIGGIKKLFGISDLEIEAKLRRKGLEREALADLVIEHMALLAIQS
ncbi:MAG: KEOPS complex subunit Cgi121 [Candidatus Bathyarchaeota archaeon]|nr:KEOPS complex subunit Cgi121 [Candidatus Bathyarchaeota archaeon]MDH5702440.1 KEOPS complex subunit Cgi121 [Candidatus Bathyarchaeota archaeon]